MPIKPFVYNKTRKKVLCAEGKVLQGLAMGLGAMFKGLKGKALVFVWWRETRIALTNVFVPEPIDVLWLDKRGKVVAVHAGFPPGALHTANAVPAKYVVELPSGTIKKSRTRTGDMISCNGLKLG